MQRAVMVAVIAATLWVGSTARAGDADPGRDTYLRYCGACHGPGAKGDGIAGTFMRPKPTDLTLIAKGHGGEFPFQHVMDVIDGRATVRAHGDPQMPVWGEIFAEQASWDQSRRAEVRGKIMAIAAYLRSIQEK